MAAEPDDWGVKFKQQFLALRRRDAENNTKTPLFVDNCSVHFERYKACFEVIAVVIITYRLSSRSLVRRVRSDMFGDALEHSER